jgi:hypothetical protein
VAGSVSDCRATTPPIPAVMDAHASISPPVRVNPYAIEQP